MPSTADECRVIMIRGVEGFKALAGSAFAPSDWLEIDQGRVDDFARTTGDDQWIHIDVRRAALSPYKTTIAQGLLTLSLIPKLWHSVARVEGFTSSVLYGLEHVRFSAPVFVPSRVRATFTITEVKEITAGVRVRLGATLEREGEVKPVCIAEMLAVHYL